MPDPRKTRAGRYIRQAEGYSAFVPAALPPDPPINMDQRTWSLLSKADRALARLDGAAETLPNPDLFVYMYVRKEAVLSSQIEGTQASLDDLLEFEARPPKSPRFPDVREVANYVAAMNHGLQRLSTLPVSLRLIREIHSELLADSRGSERAVGEFRHSQNWIGTPGCTLSEATFVPPPVHEMLPALNDLERFCHAHGTMPDLIQVGLIHAQFETIHPFLDGNGRIGRLIIPLYLVSKGILKKPVLYLSDFFEKNRQLYFDNLSRTREKDDLVHWILFFLTGIIEIAKNGISTFDSILKLKSTVDEKIQKLGSRMPKARRVLDFLYNKPVINAQMVAEVSGLSLPSAYKLIEDLEKMKILIEITGSKRDRSFIFGDYIKLFQK